ncbi:MAG: murein transglycosylase A, partial [Pseudomonadota bacterium]
MTGQFGMALVVSALALLQGCSIFGPSGPPDPHIADAVEYERLRGWDADALVDLLPAIASQCDMDAGDLDELLCAHAREGSPTALREHLVAHYRPHRVLGSYGAKQGLITGYYEPLLHGDDSRSERYQWPLYARPDDLVRLDLAERYPVLEGQRVRGRLVDRRVVPYWTRAEIDGPAAPLAGNEILWVDDPVDAFFLHVQGSGVVAMPDGRLESVGYSDQNGHPYRSIGRELVERDALPLEDVSLFTIRQWLADNPSEAQALLNENPSYVFFTRRGSKSAAGPLGTLGVPLTPERSIAVDPRVVPLGSLVWLDTRLEDDSVYRRLMLAQDTGGAIAGRDPSLILVGEPLLVAVVENQVLHQILEPQAIELHHRRALGDLDAEGDVQIPKLGVRCHIENDVLVRMG